MARLSEHGIRLSCMSPSYLNSNSTSHTWPFSALAELIDNASDPGVTAKRIWIDVVQVKEQLCLTFIDNGSGMTPSKLHKMLSFGFTDKGSNKASQPIGVYGNGFKSGSMRLGKDALIFTKNGGCLSVGMLSQSYLQAIHAQAVIVPIVPFNQQTKQLVVTEDSEASLKAILTHSLFSSQDELLEQLDSIPSKKGTKILIWNIRRNKDGKPELDFETDKFDIRMPPIRPEEMGAGGKKGKLPYPQRTDQSTPEMDYSLRAYLSILYLKPRTQIILRHKKVLTKLVAKSLSNIEHDIYKPNFINKRVKITFGFNHKNKEHYGIMMYHKNRLIKSYEKVGCQVKSSGQRSGIGVVGVIECNFLKPAHNKQDFEYTKEYRLMLAALGMKLNDYWKEKKEQRSRQKAFRALARKSKERVMKTEDEHCEEEDEEEEEEALNWIQCADCLKWRRLPAGVTFRSMPENWTCSQHPVSRLRSCLLPEEAEDSDDEFTPSYQKTFKKHGAAIGQRGSKVLEEEENDYRLSDAEVNETSSETTGAKEENVPVSRKRKVTFLGNQKDKRKCPVPETEKHKVEETENYGVGDIETRPSAGNGDGENDNMEVPSFDQGDMPVDMTKKVQNKYAQTSSRISAPALAQTGTVPPLSRTGDQGSNPFSLEGMDRVTMCQRVTQLEREADRLRRVLGTATVPCTPVNEEPGRQDSLQPITKEAHADGELLSLCTERDRYKNKVSELQQKCEQLQETWKKDHQELLMLRHKLSSAQNEFCWGEKCRLQCHDLETELQRPKREEEELKGQPRQDDRNHHRHVQEQGASMLLSSHESIALQHLHEVRKNVVSLLSSILPHLDLQGISFDTDDVDNILRQIIEANGL